MRESSSLVFLNIFNISVHEEKIRISIEKNVDMAATRLRYVPNCVKNVTDSSFPAFVWYWGVCDYPVSVVSRQYMFSRREEEAKMSFSLETATS